MLILDDPANKWSYVTSMPASQMRQCLSSTKGDKVATGQLDLYLIYVLGNLTPLGYCSINEHQFPIKMHKLPHLTRNRFSKLAVLYPDTCTTCSNHPHI